MLPRSLPAWMIVVLGLMKILLIFAAQANEVTDLWFLISSYEDQKLTPNELADFLTAHGYQAAPHGTYVTVSVSGEKLYLVPNGAAPGLVDIYLTQPSQNHKSADIYGSPSHKPSSEALAFTRVAGSLEIKRDATYARAENTEFKDAVREAALFPITPYGMCYEGSKRMGRIYTDLGYVVEYMYNPDNPPGQGHEWIMVEDKAAKDEWQAVDSYYGATDSIDYYYAPYSFPKQGDIYLIMPQLIV